MRKILLILIGAILVLNSCNKPTSEERELPNILFAISDDQSWVHTGFAGCDAVKTPAFDWIASNGVYFENAYCSAPSCTPSRASIFTGRNGFELEEGGVLWGILPAKFETYTNLLEKKGYFIGYTGKGWAPGSIEESGREKNPAGMSFSDNKNTPFPSAGDIEAMSNVDYAENFKKFLEENEDGKPFCFWYGGVEPHRPYDYDLGEKIGIDHSKIEVPEFLPDNERVRKDIANYLTEIQWFDMHLQKMIDILRKNGELDNTIIVVTSDNGMPFPRAKANLYEYGTHLPLAIYWGNIKGGRIISDMVSFTDFAPTFLEAAGIEIPEEMSGKSLIPVLKSDQEGKVDEERNRVFTYRERHAWVQPKGLPTPVRAIRKDNWLLIWNMKPELWPAGHEDGKYSFDNWPFGDIDHGPSKEEVMKFKYAEDPFFYEMSMGKRPEYELYDVSKDPYQLENLAEDKLHEDIVTSLKNELTNYLTERKDPRLTGGAEIFQQAPYFGYISSGNMFLEKWQSLSEEEKKEMVKKSEAEYEEVMEFINKELYQKSE